MIFLAMNNYYCKYIALIADTSYPTFIDYLSPSNFTFHLFIDVLNALAYPLTLWVKTVLTLLPPIPTHQALLTKKL